MIPIKEKYEKILPQLLKTLGLKNRFAAPRLVKVVVATGTGKRRDKKQQALIADRLAKITGQKPAWRGAKRAIASFKVRLDEPIGLLVTMRGKRLERFLDKFLNVAVPRMRDFRGFEESMVDDTGNLNLGIREHTIFPETADEDLKDVFGFAITIVTTAGTRDNGLAFFRALDFPFRKS
ncbi:MAG: 50S ribosomal protein L5 [Candidatus Vogelbacteria bacterium]|nr:50S ribosomal protein L5 [Candidatus Vogelbacteria bacterium]